MDLTPEEILVAHQRHRGGCLCGWSELGKSLPGHQVAMLREAALLSDAQAAGRENLAPEPPFERGERLTAERVEAVMLAAAQDAITASPDWTGGFRVPVSRWLTTLSETIEHGAAATDEHHGALALANLVLRGPYQAGREDAARATCQENKQLGADHPHECDREHGHRSRIHRCACGVEWWPIKIAEEG